MSVAHPRAKRRRADADEHHFWKASRSYGAGWVFLHRASAERVRPNGREAGRLGPPCLARPARCPFRPAAGRTIGPPLLAVSAVPESCGVLGTTDAAAFGYLTSPPEECATGPTA